MMLSSNRGTRSARNKAAKTSGFIVFCVGFFALPAVADLVVNEIDYDQPGTDFAEFVELKNVSANSVNLNPYTLELINGSGGGAALYQTVDLPDIALAPGAYYVLCEDASTVPGCNLDILSSVQNGGPDAVAIRLNGVLVDTVSYEGDTAAPYTETSGVGLQDPGTTGNDNVGISRVPDGADTDVNNQDFQTSCITPGSANVADVTDCTPPAAEKVVINEIDYDQGANDNAEFVELHNSGNIDVALADLEIRLVNGTTGVTEQTISLGIGDFVSGTYFVVCTDAANTANCDVDVAAATDLIGDAGPRAVALYQSGALIDTVSYAGDSVAPFTEGSGAGLVDNGAIASVGLSRFPNGADSDQNNVDLSLRCSTPGAVNTSVAANCTGGASQEIFAIQGSGLTSPVAGQVVTSNDNTVTAVGTDGFYMQTPDARSDGDPQTSNGIFVFTGAAPSVAVGDQVDVTGTVDEFFDLTEFTNSPLVSVDSSGNPLPAVITLDETMPSPNQPQPDNEMERFEGMLVSFNGITSGPSDQFGDVPVVADTIRPFREPGIAYPGLPGLPVWDGNPQIFEINPDDLGFPNETFMAGQPVIAQGPLTYSFGDYSVSPTSLFLGPSPGLPRAVRAGAAGELTVATYNMLRFFDTVDDPLVDDAVTLPADFEARLQKFSHYIRNILATPDIVAVQEVENLFSLQALADRLSSDEPGVDYTAWLIEGNDIGGIDVGYLTRDATVTVNQLSRFGENLLLSFDGSLLFDRPPLVLDAVFTGGGANLPITIINLHQRSLGGIDGAEAVRVKTKRLEGAQQVAIHAQSLQENDPSINLMVTGDFNAYEFTDGYVDVTGQITGLLDPLGDEFATTDIVNPDLHNHVLDLPADERYSFIFDGSAQALDHTATSTALAPLVSDAAFARGNADAPASLLLATGPDIGLRVSDHDSFVVYIDATAGADLDGDGIADAVDNCTLDANPLQIDSDGDAIGNVCDGDISTVPFPNDCLVNFLDLGTMKAAFFSTPALPNWNPDADMVGLGNSDPDGAVNFFDLGRMKAVFFAAPGPSAAGCN